MFNPDVCVNCKYYATQTIGKFNFRFCQEKGLLMFCQDETICFDYQKKEVNERE